MSSILIVEDEPAIAEVIAINLHHAGFVVRIAYDGEQAQAEIDGVLPHLVILDWMLPQTTGQALARRWRLQPRTKALPIIMLTARAEEADKVSGLDSGVDDYLTKPFSTSELLARIRALLRRLAPQALDTTVVVGELSLNPATRRVIRRGHEVKLGATEFKLLHFLMTHPERVHSRLQVLNQVWGDHVFIEERTVDVHVKRLRDSLRLVDCDRMVETVRGAGYRLADPTAAAST